MATDDENNENSELEAAAARIRAEQSAPFDEAAERAKYLASARDFVERNGYQAVAMDQSTGEGIPVWTGSRVHSQEHEAVVAANKWIAAKVAQAAKVHELRRRRRPVLGPQLSQLMARFDELDQEGKAIARQKKALQDRVRSTVREAESPDVRIDYYEGTGDYVLEVIEGGKTERIDDRQQTLDLGDGDGDGDEPEAEASANDTNPSDGDGESSADPEDRPGMDPNAVSWPSEDGDGDGDESEPE